ncbi:folate-binding protein YgfZ [Pseudorhodobacter turbinis]|uniref:Folate-binding protein YgfZ n=1 Tax=Pseudorhodobacter turbinis TaxID=2500533 RepID=A0A4P8EDX5_9RHOB|nr:folate-binding protein YgfZ [Pseudorhodobacter turbinis]QCO54907.1 folate-binding protein YgfZ [Pseudorhodobacter turbinis]
MQGEMTTDRRLISVTGTEALGFLQGLVSNDVLCLQDARGIVWAAFLTPQGKYLADFFVVNTGDALLLDLPEALADATIKRLTMYKLRADVQLTPSPQHVIRGLGTAPDGAMADPRHPALGWRLYGETQGQAPTIDWDAIRVEHAIPQSGVELIPDDSYLLEMGFERLHGVDFRKGCYVGQEVTARMKHKTELRKGLARVRIEGTAPIGTEITTQNGKPAGTLFTQSGGFALAYLRFDRATGPMQAGDATVSPLSAD